MFFYHAKQNGGDSGISARVIRNLPQTVIAVLAGAAIAILPSCANAGPKRAGVNQPVRVASATDSAPALGADANSSDADTLDMTQWFPVTTEYDKFEPSPIDQSKMLDGPAGKHGFMKNVNGHWAFTDGAPVRLVAVGESPIIPKDKQQADYIAHWLAKWGINMVRLHPLVEDVIDKGRDDSGHLDSGAMDRLDYFIDALAQRGIYTRFSMLYYRNVKPGDGVDMAGKDKLSTMGITFFDPKAMKANIDLEKAIMSHENPYRGGKTYGADPAICQIETTNEDSVFFYTIDGIADLYKKELDQMWTDWLLKKYGTRSAISAAWGHDAGDGPIGRMGMWEFNTKLAPNKLAQARDQARFYFELNSNYFNKSREALRSVGVKQPMSGSGWIGVGSTFYTDIYSNVPGMDYIDRHHYWGGGPGGWRIEANTKDDIAYTSVLQKPEDILKLSTERVMSLPYTISEESDVLPDQWRLASPALVTFYGSGLNGWDAPIHFSHDMTYWSGESGFTKKLYWMWPVNEPSTLCQYPALSMITRRGDIKEAPTVFVRNISQSQVFGAEALKDAEIKIGISGTYESSSVTGASEKSLAAIYAAAVGKTGIAFTPTEKPNVTRDLSPYLDMKNKRIKSITGELYWDYKTGYAIANTPRTQAVVGFVTGIPVKLKDCVINTSNKIASIIVSSWDGKPLAASKHVLITAVGRSRNTGMAYSRDGHHLLVVGESPILLEGIAGTVALKRTGRCTVTALSPLGYKTVAIKPITGTGTITIPMAGANKAVYYDVVFQ